MKPLHLAAACALLACACDDGPPSPSTASTVPAADRARAQVITDAKDLIGGPKASGRVGDLLIANTKVRFVVAAGGRSRMWFPTGGSLIDADRVRAAGEPDDDRLQEMVTRVGGLRMLYADKVEVASDGSDGNDAVVRVTGHDASVPILQSVVPMAPFGAAVVTEYRLAPYATSLEIVTTVTNKTSSSETLLVGDVFDMADYLTLFAPGFGTDRGKLSTATGVRYVAAFGGSVAYGYVAPGDKMALLFPQSEIFALGLRTLKLAAGASTSFTRYFAVGGADAASLLPEIVRREGGDATKLVSVAGTVSEQDTNAPVAGAQVQFSDGNGPESIAVSDGSGHYAAPLERAAYSYVATAPSRMGPTQMLDVTGGTAPASADAHLTATGKVVLAITDAAGDPTPARVSISRRSDGAGMGYYLSGDGKGEALLPPGDYHALVSRGYEWEVANVDFSVAAGKATPVAASLAHSVDTSGFVALDSHTHTAISVDSSLDPHERVAHALADGVELVVTTDHDVLFDLSPTMAEMGLAGTFATAIGCEVSPVPGHINGYPALPEPGADSDGYWPVKWWTEDPDHEFVADLWPKDIFAAIRTKLGAEVVQINHPRSGQGVLNWVGYDPSQGLKSVDPTQFDMGWDVIEICNAGCGSAPDSVDVKTLKDYYSFLDQGYRKGAVGVSDQHGSGGWLGRARTMVEVHDDDPKTLDENEVWASLKGGRNVVLDGAFVTFTVAGDDGKPVDLGGLAKATGSKVTLHAKVQAPSWIPTDRITVIVDGTIATSVDLTGAKGVTRFDGDIPIDGPAGDAWVLLIVDSDGSMAPVLDGSPRTITNPIYLDRNGDGSWEAPGL